ncbi:unnamed protein product [Mytilus edulis]|uniref:HTH iclR-type domain-containing protein n=1 Tax=Mytilus edulis TaxID=6550 RepID=A0A8S3U401_MYTED|nr:unnamed protein product [Mytilus edulis]
MTSEILLCPIVYFPYSLLSSIYRDRFQQLIIPRHSFINVGVHPESPSAGTFGVIGITEKTDIYGKGGAAGGYQVLCRHWKNANVSRSLVFKWHKRFGDGRDNLEDDEREGRPSFRKSETIKDEVLNVINSDRRLTVREVADKCDISKTTAHHILANDLNMNRVCARWVPRLLTAEFYKRMELSNQFIKNVSRGGIRF